MWKFCADTDTEYPFVPFMGKLNKPDGPGRYITLSVPQKFVDSVFDRIKKDDPDIIKGPDKTHISVMTDDDIEEAGGIDEIKPTDFNKDYRYELLSVESTNPEGWEEMDKVWFIQVKSRELEQFREKYDLSALPNDDHEFHITVGVRKKKKNKKAASWRTNMLDNLVSVTHIIPGLDKKAAGGATSLNLLKQVLTGLGQPGGAKAFGDLGSKAIRYSGGGGAGTRGLVDAWKASPRLRRAGAGSLVGGGLGGAYGTAEGYSEGGIPGAMWGGFSRGMAGAGLGGIAGGLGGSSIYKGIGSLRAGAKKTISEYATAAPK